VRETCRFLHISHEEKAKQLAVAAFQILFLANAYFNLKNKNKNLISNVIKKYE